MKLIPTTRYRYSCTKQSSLINPEDMCIRSASVGQCQRFLYQAYIPHMAQEACVIILHTFYNTADLCVCPIYLHDPDNMCLRPISLTWPRQHVHEAYIPYMTHKTCAWGLYPLYDPKDMCMRPISLTWPIRHVHEAYIPYMTQTCVWGLYPLHDSDDMCMRPISLTWPIRHVHQAHISYAIQETGS